MHTSKARPGIHSPLPMGRQEFSHPQDSRAPSRLTGTWEDKRHHSQRPPFLLLPQLYLPTMTSYGLGYPLGQSGSAVPAVSPPTPCAPPASLLVGWGEKQKSPWLWVSPAQQERKHPWVISTVFSTDPNHSPILATVKKINSIPAKTSTTS